MSDNLKPVDEGLQKEVLSYIKFKASRGTAEEKQEFNNLANLIPGTRAVMPVGVSLGQGNMIGTSLMPSVVATPDGTQAGSFPIFSKDRFFTGDSDVVAPGGGRPSSEFTVTWESAKLKAHARDAVVDVTVERALAAAGIDAAVGAVDQVRGMVEIAKEKAIATKILATGSYASGSHYTTLTSTDQWSHASSKPLLAVSGKIEYLRSVNGKRPNGFWVGAQALSTLSVHASILDLFKQVGIRSNTGAPTLATAETLASIFQTNVYVGDAVQTATLGGALSDIWGDNAGLIYIGPADLFSPKFGCTLAAANSPKVMPPYLDRDKGPEGSNIYSYVDYYEPVVMLNTGGYVWKDAT